MKSKITLQLKQQENKNDRGDLEQPQLVSCGNQALTQSLPASPRNHHQPSQSSSPSLFDTDQRPQLSLRSSNDPSRIEEARRSECLLIREPNLAAACNLNLLVDTLQREEAMENDFTKPKHNRLSFGALLEEDLENGSHDARTTGTGTQTESPGDDTPNGDAISLLSQLDTDDADDDCYQNSSKLSYAPALSARSKHGSVVAQDDYASTQDDDFKLENGSSPEKQLKDQPTKGFLYYIIHTIVMSGNLYAQQMLFKSAPQMAIMQLTFLRGAVCSLMMLVMINRNLKQTLIDPVDRSSVGSIIFRCVQGGISVYIGFMCVNYFTVSTVGVVCSLKPIIACMIGVLCMGERMSCKDVLSMGAILGAVFLVIFGSQGSQSASMTSNIGALIALIAQPVLLASGDTMLRKLRKMPEQLCSTYQNLMLTVLASIYMLSTGLSFDFVYTLSGQAWLFVVLSCSLTILGSVTKALAFKYCESAPLQKLSFLPNVWQFLIDLIVMSVAFSVMQLTGFSLLIAFYVLECSWGILADRLRKKEKFVAIDDDYNVV